MYFMLSKKKTFESYEKLIIYNWEYKLRKIKKLLIIF